MHRFIFQVSKILSLASKGDLVRNDPHTERVACCMQQRVILPAFLYPLRSIENMALRIMRLDKREETRAGEIVKDWRKWATDNGYIKKKSLPVEQGRMSITLEIWERLSATGDTYLFYHPEI